jgi:HEAT repeat protein
MNGRTLLILIVLLGLPLLQVASAEETFLGRSADQWSEAFSASEGQKRVHAAWAIAQFAGLSAAGPNDQLHFAELVKLVSDSDPTVRYWGVLGLEGFAKKLNRGDGGQTAALNTLLPLLEDKAAAPRIAAAQAAGALGQPEKALPVLVAAMSDPQESARIQAAAALEKLGTAARPAEPTLRKATSDDSEYVKRISERSLASLGVESKQSGTKAKAKKAKAKAKSPL